MCFSIGFVEELPGANTQGATLEEARANLEEAVELVLDANRLLAEEALEGPSGHTRTLHYHNKVKQLSSRKKQTLLLH